MSYGATEALLILAHYPVCESLDLSPQEIYLVKMRLEDGQTFRVDKELPLLLQHFSETLGVAPDAFREHYTTFYDYKKQGQYPSQAIKEKLNHHVLLSLMSARVNKLLVSNNDLLKWEFMRHCAAQSKQDPFTKDCVVPICANNASLSEVSALAFAHSVGTPSNIAKQELAEVHFLMGKGWRAAKDSTYRLNLSCFVVFAVRCVVPPLE